MSVKVIPPNVPSLSSVIIQVLARSGPLRVLLPPTPLKIELGEEGTALVVFISILNVSLEAPPVIVKELAELTSPPNVKVPAPTCPIKKVRSWPVAVRVSVKLITSPLNVVSLLTSKASAPPPKVMV